MEELKNLPPLAWLLIAAAVALGVLLAWLWRWYGQYRVRKALHATVVGGAADHLTNTLVPDGMGGSFHVDYLLLTLRGAVSACTVSDEEIRARIRAGYRE